MPASRQRPAPPEAPVQSNVLIGLVDELEARKIVGDTKPISKPTLYRMIAIGLLPGGVMVTPGSPHCSRRQEIEGAIRPLFTARNVVAWHGRTFQQRERQRRKAVR